MPKKCCPQCRSINTKKYGFYHTHLLEATGKRQRKIQRYYCLDYHKSFSERVELKGTNRYEPSLILKAVNLYFDAEASYRVVGRQFHVRPYQVFFWINDLGSNCKSFEKLAGELSPQYTSYFLADATSMSIEGEKQQLLLSADVESQDIPCAALCKAADYPSWKMVLQGLKDRIGYPAKSVIVDGDPGLLRAIRETFPGMSIQLCIKHLHSYHVYHPEYLF